MSRITIIVIIALLSFLNGRAESVETHIGEGETSRPVTSVYSLEIGSTSVSADYLSPLKYKGTELTLSGEWGKAMPFAPRKAVMQFRSNLSLASMLNPAQTARMVGLNAEFGWGMDRRWQLPGSVQLSAGGGMDFSGGAYYLIRNGNNPVQAMANVSLALHAAVSVHVRIGRLPVLLSDDVWMPSAGVFFSPQYGETYYEIYLGNHSGLVHAGWWGNNFRIENHLSATLDFGRTAMTIGYRFRAYNQWACNLNTGIFTNCFTIGVIPGGIGLKKQNKHTQKEKIYSVW